MGIETAGYLLFAAAAAGAASSVYSANTQKNTAEVNAELAKRQGAQDADAAMAQAEKIRRAGRAQAARANAALAASGVAIGEGTPVRINEEIYKNAEDDAYSTLLTGARRQRSSEDQAGIMIAEGNAAQTGGYLSAGASLLSSGASYGKWQTSQKAGK